MDKSAEEHLELVSKYAAHRQLLDQYVQSKMVIAMGDRLEGQEIELAVLGDASERGTPHHNLIKMNTPPLFQTRDVHGTLDVSIITDANVRTLTGSKYERSERKFEVNTGNDSWHVDWVTTPYMPSMLSMMRSDVLGDGNKAGSYTDEITKLIGTVAAGQVDKSTTSGIMLKKLAGRDIKHLMIKGVLYQLFLNHMYTTRRSDIQIGGINSQTRVIPRDYIISSLQDAADLTVLREVLSIETNTVLRVCAAAYPAMRVVGERTKYTNIHLEADDLKVVTYDAEDRMEISPELVLHPERWWEALCGLASLLGGIKDLCYAYNFVLGWPSYYGVMREENLQVSGQYRIPVGRSRNIDTLFGDGPMRKVDTIVNNTNKLASSNIVVLDVMMGHAILGTALDIIDDYGFADGDIYGEGLSQSEMGHGARVDAKLDLGTQKDAFIAEILRKFGKKGAPYGLKYSDLYDRWPRLIARQYRTQSSWETNVLDCVVAAQFGPRQGGMRMGLLAEVWKELDFTMGDINYTRSGEKSWEISAWSVLSGFHNRKWLLVGPIIASRVGLGPVAQVFEESSFTIGGHYAVVSNSVVIRHVVGRRGNWKMKSDQLEMNNYYAGAVSLIEALFDRPAKRGDDEVEEEETRADRKETTLRHQKKVNVVEIDIREPNEKPIEELLAEAIPEDEYYEIIQEGMEVADVVENFGDDMSCTLQLGVGGETGNVLWCTLYTTKHNPNEEHVIISEGVCYRVKKSEAKPGAFKFKSSKRSLIRESIRNIDPAILGDIILQAKGRKVPSIPQNNRGV